MKPITAGRRNHLKAASLVGLAAVLLGTQTRAMDRVREILSEGSFLLDLRPRYEQVEQSGYETAHALTLRTAVGYLTRTWRGFSALFEATNVSSPFPNEYNQSQINEGGSDRAIVTDPTATNVSQAWLKYNYGRTSITVGRQRLSLGNGRFIGDYDWRQHGQTFDAVVIQDDSFKNLALTYAYLARVNRVFGPDHPQGVYQSSSHVLHAAYSGLPYGTITGYAYLLDFEGAVVGNSCATYGLSFEGGRRFWDRVNVNYRAEYAIQSDYGSSPLFYSADYLQFEGDIGIDWVSIGAGYEKLGSENNFAFRTPLASLHEFNGWADVFLLTPSQGLRDTYFKVTGRLPWWDVRLAAYYHTFDSYAGTRLGTELDVSATWRINESLSTTLKYASFERDVTTVPEVKKLWLQAGLKF